MWAIVSTKVEIMYCKLVLVVKPRGPRTTHLSVACCRKCLEQRKMKEKKSALNSYCSQQNLRQNCRKASVPASRWGLPSALSSWPAGNCCCSDLVSPPLREPSKLLLAISALQLWCCARTGQGAALWCAAGQEAGSWTRQLTLKTRPSTLL